MLILLLKLRLKIMLNTLRFRAMGSAVSGTGEALKVVVFPLFGLILVAMSFSVGFAMFSLIYKMGGEATVISIVSSMFIGVFLFAFFSALVTAFYVLFISPDLSIWITAPVSLRVIFIEKFIEVFLGSSGFYAVLFLPALMAFGVAANAGVLFYLVLLIVSPVFLTIPTGFGMMAIMLLARFVKPGKAKEIIGAISGIAGLLIYVTSQLLPAQMEHQGTKAIGAIKTVGKVRLTFLPSDWAAQLLIKGGLAPYSNMVLPGVLILSVSVLTFVLALAFTERAYYTGLTNVVDASGVKKMVKSKERTQIPALSGPIGAIVRKDTKYLMRDTQEWIQLLWPLAAMFIFVLRFSGGQSGEPSFDTGFEAVFPAVFLMLLMSMFAVRLSLTALSRELKSVWIIHQAPVERSTIVVSKLVVAYFPSLVMAEIVYIIIALVKGFPPGMVALGVLALAGILLGSNALGVMLGSIYPKFDAKNPRDMVKAQGSYLFLALNTAYIVVSLGLAALPQFGRLLQVNTMLLWVLSVITLYAVAGLVTIGSVRIASRRLEHLEITA